MARDGGVTVEVITDDEAWDDFDHAARRLLGMSGQELIEKWDRGELTDQTRLRGCAVVALRQTQNLGRLPLLPEQRVELVEEGGNGRLAV